jgi:chromate transporter
LATTGPARLTQAQIFALFFKAGLGFGGGLAVLALLEEELVTRRRMMSRTDLIGLWSIGRIVPCGTMTAVTVAIGHRFGGLLGTVVALTAVILPGFLCTVAMAAAYAVLGHGLALDYVKVTLIPAALSIILVSAVRIAGELSPARSGGKLSFLTVEVAFAVAAFVAAVIFRINPTLLLFGGGVLGALFLRGPAKTQP